MAEGDLGIWAVFEQVEGGVQAFHLKGAGCPRVQGWSSYLPLGCTPLLIQRTFTEHLP